MWSLVVFVTLASVLGVRPHGFLQEPPARNSMWRQGFNTEPNYNDMGLNCGGFSLQWDHNGGKCGLCGDPYGGPWEHEAGGKYASITRPISRCYNTNTRTIDITTRITAYHKGYFEFRLCVNNDLTTDPGQDCLDNGYLLNVTGATGSNKHRYDINAGKQDFYTFRLDLPESVECSQCILHWKYNAGNSEGCEVTSEGRKCAIGLGPQEQFINCADIAIRPDCSYTTTVDPKVTVVTPSVTQWTGTTRGPTTTDSTKKSCPQAAASIPRSASCVALGSFASVPGMAEWCVESCFDVNAPHCPPEQCSCATD